MVYFRENSDKVWKLHLQIKKLTVQIAYDHLRGKVEAGGWRIFYVLSGLNDQIFHKIDKQKDLQKFSESGEARVSCPLIPSCKIAHKKTAAKGVRTDLMFLGILPHIEQYFLKPSFKQIVDDQLSRNFYTVRTFFHLLHGNIYNLTYINRMDFIQMQCCWGKSSGRPSLNEPSSAIHRCFQLLYR